MAHKIIRIRPGEQIDTIIKIIKNSHEDHIIFIDEDNRLLLRETNLHLLSYFLQEENKTGAIITKSREIRGACSRLNIPAYESMEDVYREELSPPVAAVKELPAEKGLRQIEFNSRLWIWAAGLFILFLAALSLIFIFTPQATIVVYPQVKPVIHEFSVQARVNNANMLKDSVPARLLSRNIERKIAFPSTGHKFVGIKEAEGVVLFVNSGPKPIVIPKGTIVSTSNGIKFATQQEVIVPKMSAEKFFDITTGVVAGRAEVNIKALEKGTLGNVKEGRITKIVDKFSSYLKVVNPENTRYGEDRMIRVVAEADIAEAKMILEKELPDKAEEELLSMVTNDYIFLKGLFRLQDKKYTVSPGAGQEADEVEVKVNVRASALVVAKAELIKYLTRKVLSALPPDFNLVEGKTAILEILDSPGPKAGSAELLVRTQSEVVGRIDSKNLVNSLKGMTLADARAKMANMSEISWFDIHPGSKSKRLPNLPFQIKVVVQRPRT